MRKSFIKAAAVLGLVGVLSMNTFAMSFKDVSNSHWAYSSVVYMQKNGYMLTNSQGEFFPNQKMTYFDIAEILAKATGYQDENVIKDMDETLKQNIRQNYEKQKPLLQAYGDKYTGWKASANEEIAYLLGKGFLTPEDLNNFMVKTADGKNVVNALNKEDLSVYLVRVLLKENTAKSEYTSTGFNDEAKISKEARPHVAYLKKLGIVGGDAKGNFNPDTSVTRAIGAKMIATTLQKQDKDETPTSPSEDGWMSITVDRVQANSTKPGEYYVISKKENGSSDFYYLQSNTAKITDLSGKSLSVEDIAAGDTAKIKTIASSGPKYISEIQLQKNTGTTTPPVTPEQGSSYQGKLERVGANGDLSITTPYGFMTYMMDSRAVITKNGQSISKEMLQVGDTIKITVQNSMITKVDVIYSAPSQELNNLEMVSVIQTMNGYNVTVKQNGTSKVLSVPGEVLVTRNRQTTQLRDLKIGDKLVVKNQNGRITEIHATGEEKTYTGKVKSILIAAQPELTISTPSGEETFAVTYSSELYDSKNREDITIRDLIIGSEVKVFADSNEAMSVIVEDMPQGVTYKGRIESVGKGTSYIDVVVDYDPLVGQPLVVKRINISGDVKILKNGVEQYLTALDKNVEVLITLNDMTTMIPDKIQILD